MPAVYFRDAKIEKERPNTIRFKYIPVNSCFEKAVYYTGTDLYGPDLEIYFTIDEIKKFNTQLKQIFGYCPFDKKRVKAIMKERKGILQLEY